MDCQSKIREERTVTVYAGVTEPLATMHENDVRNLLRMVLDEVAVYAENGSITKEMCRQFGMKRVPMEVHLSVSGGRMMKPITCIGTVNGGIEVNAFISAYKVDGVWHNRPCVEIRRASSVQIHLSEIEAVIDLLQEAVAFWREEEAE